VRQAELKTEPHTANLKIIDSHEVIPAAAVPSKPWF
jgi:hypothetical protein